jgi:hypothetical protein
VDRIGLLNTRDGRRVGGRDARTAAGCAEQSTDCEQQ